MLAVAGARGSFVSGDTGPLHLAAAVGAPIVGLYGPDESRQATARSTRPTCVSRFASCVCHHERRCRRQAACIDEITLAEVQDAVDAAARLNPVPAVPFVRRLARLRVPLGFVFGAVVLYVARPTWTSIALGTAIGLVGEGIRFWAAGHLEKSREVTQSGPYRFTRHPLYVGSSVMGLGVAVGTASWIVFALVAIYMGATIAAAIRTEEAFLRERFGGQYDDYARSRGPAMERPFSLERAWRNREYRAMTGLAVAVGLLVLKAAWF